MLFSRMNILCKYERSLFSNAHPRFPEKSSLQEYKIAGRSLISTYLILRGIQHEEQFFFVYPPCRAGVFLSQAMSKHAWFHRFSFLGVFSTHLSPGGNHENKMSIEFSEALFEAKESTCSLSPNACSLIL